MGFSNSKSSVDDERIYRIRLLGTGAADPTVEVKPSGVTVTRQGVGVHRITLPDGAGTFIGMAYMFGAATPADVKGQTCTRDTYTVPTATARGFVDIAIWSSTFAADELNATEYLDLTLVMQE